MAASSDFPTSLSVPDEVVEIVQRLEVAGYETWCVGGAVRDALLGQENKDFDIATAATPDVVQKLFKRTVPIGIKHGTVAVLDKNREPHEVTTFRRDVKTDGRHAEVEFGVSLDEDLARRDFTINAIAYHPLKKEWQDPFGGEEDLKKGVIRAVGDPDHRVKEDYLRILRALRFAARFGFEIESVTWAAMRANISGLEYLSAERVREEWFGGLKTAEKPSQLVKFWSDVGALGLWLPEVLEGVGNPDWESVDNLRGNDPILSTCLLTANPAKVFERLRCSRSQIERGRRIGSARNNYPDPKDAAEVRKWMSKAYEVVDDLVLIAEAYGSGSELRGAVGQVRASGAPLRIQDLAVSGDDLIEMGVPKGPEVGRVLRELLGVVLEEPGLNERSVLVQTIRV